MLKIAYFSPLPPAATGIADYSRELIAPLAEMTALTLFAPSPEAVDADIRARYPVRPEAVFPEQRWSFDLALYHMGNSGFYHAGIYETALRYPGVVALHEVFLPDFIAHVTIGRGDHAAYAREMGYESGATGYEQAWRIRLGRRPGPAESMQFSRRLIDRSLGVVVHSQSAAELVRRPGAAVASEAGRPRIAVLPQLVARTEATSMRHALNLPVQTVIFATTGLVNASKRLDQALDAFARVKESEPDTFFLIVGGVHADVDLAKLIRERGLQNHVHHTGRVGSLAAFAGWTMAADVVVTLRQPTLGEASNAAVRALAAGKPLIVYDEGWYGELPESVCLKVPSLDEQALTGAMLYMVRQPQARQEMGRAATAYAADKLDPGRVARQYEQFMTNVLRDIRAEPHQ